jgi:UDP-N-acetylglucosamine 4-epimerase
MALEYRARALPVKPPLLAAAKPVSRYVQSTNSEACMTAYEQLRQDLAARPQRWLVTGVAGFIGSNLLETLLGLDQEVVGLDSFATGHRRNLDLVRDAVGPERWARFALHEGDIRDAEACRRACQGVQRVLHQAALGSVPRSIEDPQLTNDCNVGGFVNMLAAAKDAGCERFVYASSSSVYGDHPDLPKVEEQIGAPLSPYAASKYINEVYADVFARTYGAHSVGLRYFNVFGPRQDPEGAYAAVMPKWFAAFLRGERPVINGDGETSRDFCYIADTVQANLLAACTENPEALDRAYNVAVGTRTSLNQLFAMIRERVAARRPRAADVEPEYRDFRPGDVRHSLADTSAARTLLGYEPQYTVAAGLDAAADWYIHNLGGR